MVSTEVVASSGAIATALGLVPFDANLAIRDPFGAAGHRVPETHHHLRESA